MWKTKWENLGQRQVKRSNYLIESTTNNPNLRDQRKKDNNSHTQTLTKPSSYIQWNRQTKLDTRSTTR